jgi:hypothetical protein
VPADLAAVDKVADMDARVSRIVANGRSCNHRTPWYEVTAVAWDLGTAPGVTGRRCATSAPPPARRGSAGAGSRPHARPSART